MPTRSFRTDANGDYGLTRDGVANDSTIAEAAPGNRDDDGPGGRWCTTGVPTTLGWEATAPAPELSAPVLYHHARSVDHVRFGTVLPVRRTQLLPAPNCLAAGSCDWDDDWHFAWQFEAAYGWLAEEVGFWPLFLAVGATDEDRRMTGYQNQWSRAPVWGSCGRPRDVVLFSWSTPPERVVHLDYDHWHIVLGSAVNLCHHDRAHVSSPRLELGDARVASWVMHRSWRQSAWLRHARRHPHTVQAVSPALDLAAADAVWAPNQRVARRLLRLGFSADRVAVQRLRVGD